MSVAPGKCGQHLAVALDLLGPLELANHIATNLGLNSPRTPRGGPTTETRICTHDRPP